MRIGGVYLCSRQFVELDRADSLGIRKIPSQVQHLTRFEIGVRRIAGLILSPSAVDGPQAKHPSQAQNQEAGGEVPPLDRHFHICTSRPQLSTDQRGKSRLRNRWRKRTITLWNNRFATKFPAPSKR